MKQRDSGASGLGCLDGVDQMVVAVKCLDTGR